MTKIHGKHGVVKVGDVVVGSVTDWEVSETVPLDDTTAQGDASATHLVGILSWSGSLTCQLDKDDAGQSDLLGVGASVDLELYPTGDASSRNYRVGTATVGSVRESVPLGVVTRAIDFTGNGPLGTETVA